MDTVKRRIVTAFVVSGDDELLIGRKDPARGGVYPDCWHLPGGGVEPNESDIEAIKREIYEETGLDASGAIISLVDDTDGDTVLKRVAGKPDVLVAMQFNVFLIRFNEPSDDLLVADGDDLIDVHWQALDTLQEIKLTPPAYKLFNRKGTDWLHIKH